MRHLEAILGPFALAAAFWAAAGPSPTYPTPQAAHVAAPADPLASALATLNAARAAKGVPPLTLDVRLNRAAQIHCDDLASGRVSYANDPHGGFPQRLWDAFFPRGSRVSEGVFPEIPGVDLQYWATWMGQDPREAHARDLLDPTFNLVGIGHSVGNFGGQFTGVWCLDYGAGKPVPPPTPPPAPGPSPVATAAASYRATFPAELRKLADAVDAGRVATFDDLTGSLAKARGNAASPLNAAFGVRWAPSFDASRRLTNRADVAKSIREAAAGWEGVPGGK